MDINDIRGLGNVGALVAFLGVIWWAYGSKRKERFEEDSNLPFADEQCSSETNTDNNSKC